MTKFRINKWSKISLAISITCPLLIFVLAEYLGQTGRDLESSSLEPWVHIVGGTAFLLSLLTAIVGITRRPFSGLAVAALLVSLLSFVFYVR
jgi:hypothetical protein